MGGGVGRLWMFWGRVGWLFVFFQKNYARSAKITAGLFWIRPNLNLAQGYHFKGHFWIVADMNSVLKALINNY
jgi:hypothetical protein